MFYNYYYPESIQKVSWKYPESILKVFGYYPDTLIWPDGWCHWESKFWSLYKSLFMLVVSTWVPQVAPARALNWRSLNHLLLFFNAQKCFLFIFNWDKILPLRVKVSSEQGISQFQIIDAENMHTFLQVLKISYTSEWAWWSQRPLGWPANITSNTKEW